MTARHPTPTRTDPPFPYTTPCRSGDFATADDIARLHTALGLDEPLWRQFGLWAGRLLQGDLGTSIFTHVPVTHLLAQRRSEEHTSEPQSLMRISYAVFCLKKINTP